ncbi:MAG: hypothetical protein EBU90_19345, partial [Proteobacteria bacterium]|nr:hypothetical protein [Pseudomonadota bacterium]
YGNLIGSVGTGIASFINANKKQDPTGRPYKTGTNMIKSKKSKLIKYQTGVNSTATGDPEDLNAYFGRVLGKNKTSSQVTQPQGEVGPTRKEAANLMRKYNQDIRNNPNVIGAIDEDAYKRSEELTGLGITKPIMKSTPSSLLTPKQVSFTAPEQPSTSPRLNKVPIEKPSRRERRKENESFFKMANKQDIEYMTPRTPTLGENIPDRKPLIKMVEQQPVTGKRPKMFDYTSKEAKGGYARALKYAADNKGITKQGWLTDPETGLVYKDLRAKKTNTSNPKVGQELVRMNRMGKQNNFYTPGGLPIPIQRPEEKRYKDNSQLFKRTGGFQDGTKKVSAKPTKQDYLDAAAKMTPEQRRQFHELDAKGVKFKFGDLYYTGLQKGKRSGKTATTTPSSTDNTTAQTPPKNTPVPQVESGGQYSNVDWSGKSGFTFKNPVESIVRPLARIGVGASSKGLKGVGAGLIGEMANIVADYTPKGTVNSVANNIQTMADAYNAYRAVTASGVNLKNMKPKQALEYLKNFWKNKIQIQPKVPGTFPANPAAPGQQLSLPF